MRRNDYERRRLRDLYDRNARRVRVLADARDRRRADRDEIEAPRRFLVTAHRTRLEGFGRGGLQARRGARGGRRFRDASVFRRATDRFARDEDFQRAARRERFRPAARPRVQRLRRRLQERLARLDRLEGRTNPNRPPNKPNRQPNKPNRQPNNHPNNNAQRGGGRGRGRGKPSATRADLDAELERFRGN